MVERVKNEALSFSRSQTLETEASKSVDSALKVKALRLTPPTFPTKTKPLDVQGSVSIESPVVAKTSQAATTALQGEKKIPSPLFDRACGVSKGAPPSLTRKPVLEPPKIGAFPLSFLLDKMSLASTSDSYTELKQELELTQAATEQAHKEMLKNLKEATDHERKAARWGIAVKVFSWLASLTSICTGIILVATGVGAVAGALMIVGGVVSVTNQVMETTGAWNKVADLIPTDDLEKKRAIITWIQLGVSLLSLVISGCGIVLGGFSIFQEASQFAMLFFGSVITAGGGVCSIGNGVEEGGFRAKSAEVKRDQTRVSVSEFGREDLQRKLEESSEQMLTYYQSISKSFGFLDEMNKTYQRSW